MNSFEANSRARVDHRRAARRRSKRTPRERSIPIDIDLPGPDRAARSRLADASIARDANANRSVKFPTISIHDDRSMNAIAREGRRRPRGAYHRGAIGSRSVTRFSRRTLFADARTTVEALELFTTAFWARALPANVDVDAATDIFSVRETK